MLIKHMKHPVLLIIGAVLTGLAIWRIDFPPSGPVVQEAEQHIGVPHLEGGEFPEQGFDSSGFVQYVFHEVYNFMLPRTLDQQVEQGEEVARNSIEEGDVLFFSKDGEDLTHSAIYMGNDRIIHPTVSNGVKVTRFEENSYWNENFREARRVTGPSDIAEDHVIVTGAQKYLDVPYVFGGETPDGFDCSGFVQYVFKEASQIYLPRTTDQQWETGQKVKLEDIMPGDVLFFSDTYREGISHNGIYMGGRPVHPCLKNSGGYDILCECRLLAGKIHGGKKVLRSKNIQC